MWTGFIWLRTDTVKDGEFLGQLLFSLEGLCSMAVDDDYHHHVDVVKLCL
jgi:hypothetical protein